MLVLKKNEYIFLVGKLKQFKKNPKNHLSYLYYLSENLKLYHDVYVCLYTKAVCKEIPHCKQWLSLGDRITKGVHILHGMHFLQNKYIIYIISHR